MMKALVLAALLSSVPREPAPPPQPPPSSSAEVPGDAAPAEAETESSEETPPIPSTVEPPETPDLPPVEDAPPAVPAAEDPPPAVDPAAPPPLEPPEVPAYEPPEPPQFGTKFRAAAELSALSFPSGTPEGGQDGFVQLTPVFGVESGEDFAFELGANLRTRLFDAPPSQRDFDHEGLLRREDWDERSDFGQLLRVLKIGADGAAFSLRAGPLGQYTLGRGHVVSRYSNRLNPNYHPAGAVLTLSTGPVRVEAMTSDVLAPRIVAGELALDVARLFGALEDQFDRYHAAVTAAHDFGLAGQVASPLTLMSLEADAQLWRSRRLRLFAHGAVGTRLGEAIPTVGFLLGTTADFDAGTMRLSGRLEGRFGGGRFRHGMIGYGYELQRFADTGQFAPSIASQVFPDTFSELIEVAVTAGTDADVFADRPQVTVSASFEHFHLATSRIDWDLNAQVRYGHAVAKLRTGVVGMFEQPRFTLGAEGRYRFAPSFYALANLGTQYFPQPDGSLTRGFALGVGAAVDFER